MERIKILMPVDLLDAIKMKAVANRTTKSHETETLLRSGIAVYLKMEEYRKNKDTVGIDLCRTILRGGFGGIQVLDGGSIRLTGSEPLSGNPEERMAQITRIQKKMKKVSTTITITDGLLEYMDYTSRAVGNAPMAFVVFLFLEAAFMAWHLRVNINDESIPAEDRERALELLDDLKQTFAEFAYDELGHLQVFSEKKMRSAGMPIQKAVEIAGKSIRKKNRPRIGRSQGLTISRQRGGLR
ncbi:MAG: hypothetical protein J4F28_06165 [Nitrosopumilaceae archaeon]|nr:hypothetical protein [Nitrosopumilaceae archaeon]